MPSTPNVWNQGRSQHTAEATGGIIAHGATFTGAVHGGIPGFSRVRASAFNDQAGSLTIEQSNDATFATGVRVYSTTAVVASTLATSGDVLLYRQYWRVKCTNTSGSTDTTVAEIDTAAVYT